ncbi:hypothetical protein TNCV_4260261 [Trichonephila clavipes]|nr:hypothetical protein TNCV_4260261 [Trichonephila clavipes]
MFDLSSFANPTPLAHADTSRDVLPRGGTSQPEGLGSMPDATKYPPSTHGVKPCCQRVGNFSAVKPRSRRGKKSPGQSASLNPFRTYLRIGPISVSEDTAVS